MGRILEAFERVCREHRHQPALWSRSEGLRLTFGELSERVDEHRRRLAVGAGEVVALATGNSVSFPELFLALRRRGAAVAAVDASLPHAEKLALCRRLGVRHLFHGDAEGPGEPVAPGVRAAELDDVEPTPAPAGTALVKLTSGSTGEPAGVCFDEEALFTGVSQIAQGMEITRNDRVLMAIPLSHSYGFDNGVLSLAVVGTPLILQPGYFPSSLLRALGEGEATFFPAVPPMVRALADSDWPSGLALRRVISAGGPLAPDFARRFQRRSGLHVHQFYGSTETGGIAFETAPHEAEAAGTVGRPLPGVSVELDAASTVTVDSAANYTARLGETPRSERRVVLGDRAEWTPEGRLRLTGRVADLLNVGGRRVSAAAIESALSRLAGVEEAAVVGVEDPLRGDRIVAFVVGGAGPLETGHLPAGWVPREIRRVDALPYTERGKLDRTELRRWAVEKP